MAFDGTEGGVIDLATASAWTANHRNTGAAIYAHFYGRNILHQILDQPGCMGIRIYYAQDGSGASQMILVGVGADEGDLCNGVVAEMGRPCPNYCGVNSPLNVSVPL